jgi:ligand-binding sensor domain-containing protein
MIWVGSVNGLNRIDPKTDKITRFLYDPNIAAHFNFSNVINKMYFPPDKPGILWLTTSNGLVRLNSKTGGHERFLMTPNKGSLSAKNALDAIAPDPGDPNVLWIGGPGNGLFRFDMRTKKFTSYRHDPRDPNSLSDNIVQSIITDHSGTIWVGTYNNGVNKFNPGAVNFTNLKNEPGISSSLSPGTVWGIYEDRYRNLWVSTQAGTGENYLTEFDAATGAVKRYRSDPQNSSTLLPGSLREFAEDGNGRFEPI